MPLYEYKCKKGHVFDVFQSFSDDALTKCEICGAKAERVLSAPAIHFKGSGFHNTDYGTRKRPKGGDSESGSGSSASESGSSGSDSSGSGSSGSSDASSSGSDSGSKKSEKAASTASKD